MKKEKNLFPTPVILLVSKLQAGRVVKAQFWLKLEKKSCPTAPVILLISKLPADKVVKAQLMLKLEKKSSPTLIILLVSKLPCGREVRDHS